MLVKRQLHCQRQLQLRTPLRLPVESVRAVSRSHAAVVRAAAVEHADAASADPVPAAPAQVDSPALNQTTAVESSVDTATAISAAHSSSTNGRLPMMKVGKSSQITKSARYIQAVLATPARGPLLMRAIGGRAVAMAVRILARASEMIHASDSDSTLSFQLKGKEAQIQSTAEEVGGNWVNASDFYIVKSAAESYPAELADGVQPMWVGNSTETSAVIAHIMKSATNLAHVKPPGPVAELRVPGVAPSRLRVAMAGIRNAGFRVRQIGKSDLTVTVSRIIEKNASSEQQQQDQQDSERPQAAAAGAAAEAPGGVNESSSSGAAGVNESSSSDAADVEAEGQYRTTFALKVHVCELRAPTAAEKRRASSRNRYSGHRDRHASGDKRYSGRPGRTQSSVKSASVDAEGSRPPAARDARPSTTPGVVEVPEEEWRQLKEQIELVPHLTEQLQVMTRQHEQLLSLLTVQQQQREQQGKGEQQQ